MKVADTRIKVAGVFRCCLESVAADLKEAEEGDQSACKYCHTWFQLVDGTWIPLWQTRSEERDGD